MSNYTETRVNVTLGGGKAVHTGLRVVQNGATYKASAECGGNKACERYIETTAEVTCKKCLKLLAALAEKEAAYQDRAEASMMPATEAHDYGYVAPAEAAAEQPAEVIKSREDARDAAEDARRDAALYRAAAKLAVPAEAPTLVDPWTWIRRPLTDLAAGPEDARRDAALYRAAAKLAEQPYRVARPLAEAETCGAQLFDVMTSKLSLCVLKPGHDAGVLNSHADRLHKSAQMVRDEAHTEALGEHLLIQDPEDIARDLRAEVKVKSICTCGHGAHAYGPCHVGPRPQDGGGCDCDIYQPSGLEGVYDRETDCWGVRPVGTQMATWLPWTPTRGGLARNARIDLARRMMRRNG